MVLQLFVGLHIISVDREVKEDRYLLEACQKFFGMLITLGTAISYVYSGIYGNIELIGMKNSILLIVQLSFAGVMVMMLDELLSKGYGIGSGISLFMATNISENILWKSLSPFTLTTDRGIEYEGAITATIHFLTTKNNIVYAIKRAFFRKRIANLSNLISTFIVFLVVLYLQGFRMEIKINNRSRPGFFHTQKIKLFYCSNTPIILQNALISNLYFISQVLYRRYQNFFLVKLLGVWDYKNGDYVPVGGISYFISPPKDILDFIRNPLKNSLYSLFIILSSGFFAKTWIDISGKSSRDLARELKNNNFFLEGIRETEESIYNKLNRYIPTAAILGGCCIGTLQIFADLTGAIGSGTGILLLVDIIFDFFKDNDKLDSKRVSSLHKD
jgi:protein transport protein SEC61 subunit alpha